VTAGAAPLRAYFLVGPTAAGKSALAHWIAERKGFEIVSADSMLVYRGMDIGTAKPGSEERSRVRYHGIDLAEPDRPFSVGDYARHARSALADAARRGRRAIVVGGTGLYIKSLTDGLSQAPPADPEARERWARVLRERGPGALAEALQATAPRLYDGLPDKGNPRRLLRALEWAEAGVREPPRSWKAGRPAAALAGLAMPDADLHLAIESRVAGMYRSGLMAEVRGLLDRYGSLSPTARHAIGYAEAAAALAGECSAEEAARRTATRTRQLARRQRTWFRHQADVRWVEVRAGAGLAAAAGPVLRHWEQDGPTAVADAEAPDGAA